MECELGQILRNHRDHAGIVRAWGDLTEDHLFAFHEEFDAENAAPTERVGDRFGIGLRLFPRFR